MPLEIISGSAAFSSRNRFSTWPSPGKDGERYIPHPNVNHEAGFHISTEDKLFTIGSCFARNVERALIALGLPVLSSIVDGTLPGDNITNKYTTRTILHDLKVAFEGLDAAATIHDVGPNASVNLTFGGMGSRKTNSREEIEKKTAEYYDTLKRLKETDIVVITLGLVETWYDKKAGVYINLAPHPRLVKSDPERFEVHVLDYDDILADVREILQILRRECKPGVRFLVTVSPVPLAATFRGQNVLQANAYSKAVQRAAIEAIVLEYSDVTYFPSYEMVTLAAPEEAWIKEDYRHVRPDAVDRIMRLVVSKYVDKSALAPEKTELADLAKSDEWAAIASRVEQYCNFTGRTIEFQPAHVRWYYASALVKLERISEAVPVLATVVQTNPGHAAARALYEKLTR